MKQTMKCLLALGFSLAAGGAIAENAPAADSPVLLAQADKAAAKVAEVAPLPKPEEPLPLIMFEEAPLNDAIKTLARQAGINFQFDPKVATPPPGPDGKVAQPVVSIRFENITAQQALEAVLANHNLQLVNDTKTKTGRITIKDPAAPDPLVTKVVQLKFTNPTNMVGIIRPSLSARSTITYDVRTSQLVLIATDKELESVEKLVATLDTPTRQVLIEARIYETSRNPSSIKGIDWSGTLAAQNVKLGNNALAGTPATPASTSLDANGNPVPVPASPGTIGGILNNPGLLMNASSGTFFAPPMAFINADGVSAVISFLNTDSDTEVLSTPRAVTLDNEKTTLSVTKAFPIFQITPGSANSPAGAQITYTNLGTILEVTPRISADDRIALKVVPEVSNIDSKDSQTVGGLQNVANVYAIRKVEANVVVPSGHTLVMGGLVSDTSSKGYTKVPVLGDTPGIGGLFRKKTNTRNKQNLLIFVTPTIVQDDDFQLAQSKFLKTPIQEKSDEATTWWDSGKPYDWSKKKADEKSGGQ